MGALDEAYRATLRALGAALETRDTETHGHSERVVSFSLRLGHELDLAPDVMRSLEFGALLHDIGKIGVPDSILLKPAKLTDAEWVRMREHPNYGRQILRGIPFLEGAALVVAQHHEKWDGSGYPLGLRGEEIDINARIFSVADAFDAMISDRVYRPGRPYNLAAQELNDFSGTQFDPEVVAAFNRVQPSDWADLKRLSLVKKDETKGLSATEHVKKRFSLKTSLTQEPAAAIPTVAEIMKMRTTIVDLAAINGHDDRFQNYRSLAAQLEERLVKLSPRL
jgi:HD-GYP domain-containing protein (c-di-GMP phosphodiesterase class II)